MNDEYSHMKASKIIILGIFAATIAAFFIFDLGQYFSLESIKSQQQYFTQEYTKNPALFITIFALIYIAITALSLPIATVITLLAGALFGFWTGLVIVSFASTIGATLAFLMARYVLKDSVQDKYGKYLTKLNDGFKKEGSFYLFALRLVPVVPFFVINLGVALLPIKTWTFYWVSQLGMFIGTAVYVNAGKQLANINSIGDILTFELFISFALLGIFPLIAKSILSKYRNRHAKI